MKLYFKNIKKPKRISTFLNVIHSKYYIPSTYTDKECTDIQCSTRSSRSIDELMIIIKTYYPKTKDEIIYKEFRKFLEKNKNERVFLFCPDIKKWVLNHYYLSQSSKIFKNIRNYQNSDSSIKRRMSGEGVETYNSFMKKLGYKLEELKI